MPVFDRPQQGFFLGWRLRFDPDRFFPRMASFLATRTLPEPSGAVFNQDGPSRSVRTDFLARWIAIFLPEPESS
jgi:hypothetical protein